MNMAGLRKSREQARAHHLASMLLEEGSWRAESVPASIIALGSTSIHLGFSRKDPLTDLIVGAFLSPAKSQLLQETSSTVFILRSEDDIVLPSLEWMHPWITAQEAVPHPITNPYRLFVDRNHGMIYCFDPRRRMGCIYLRPTAHLDIRSLITPFRLMWSWIAETHDQIVLHAAAIRCRGVGLLVPGPSGSGKSTLALGLGTEEGNCLISDDCVVVQGHTAHAVYDRAKQPDKAPKASLAPSLRGIRGRSRAKRAVSLSSDVPFFQRDTKIHALIFPSVVGRSGLYSLSRDEAAEALAIDSMREVFGGTPWQREEIKRLTHEIPSFKLLLGPSQTDNHSQLYSLVGQLREGA